MPEIIESQQKLTYLLEELCPQPRLCAIDTEADSLHRYKESLCLIQLSAAGRNVLIDPLTLGDFRPSMRISTHARYGCMVRITT